MNMYSMYNHHPPFNRNDAFIQCSCHSIICFICSSLVTQNGKWENSNNEIWARGYNSPNIAGKKNLISFYGGQRKEKKRKTPSRNFREQKKERKKRETGKVHQGNNVCERCGYCEQWDSQRNWKRITCSHVNTLTQCQPNACAGSLIY